MATCPAASPPPHQRVRLCVWGGVCLCVRVSTSRPLHPRVAPPLPRGDVAAAPFMTRAARACVPSPPPHGGGSDVAVSRGSSPLRHGQLTLCRQPAFLSHRIGAASRSTTGRRPTRTRRGCSSRPRRRRGRRLPRPSGGCSTRLTERWPSSPSGRPCARRSWRLRRPWPPRRGRPRPLLLGRELR